jgi:hypothetical protein
MASNSAPGSRRPRSWAGPAQSGRSSAAAEILKVLLEVHAWTGFLDEFVYVSGNQFHESRGGWFTAKARGIVVPCSGFFV